MKIEKKIDEMNVEAYKLAFKDFEACTKQADDIIELSKKHKYIIGESNIYHNLGIAHYSKGDYEKAYKYYSQAYELIKDSSYYEKQAAALHNMAMIHYYSAQFDKAIEKNLAALDLRKKAKNENFIIMSLDFLGKCYQAQNDTENALKYFLDAYKLIKKNNDPVELVRSLANIGHIYYARNDYLKALEYFNDALEIGDNNAIEDDILDVIRSIGSCCTHLGDYKTALQMLERSLNLSKKLKNDRVSSATLDALGTYYFFINNYEKSLHYHKQALALSRELTAFREMSISLMNIGLMQQKLSFFSEAEESYSEGLKIAKEIKDDQRISDFYHSLSLFYAEQKKFEKAYEFQKKYLELSDIISQNEKTDLIEKLKVEFDLERKEREAEIHKLKNEALAEANMNLEKRVQEELKKREAQQQQLIQKSKLESIGKMAAGIAHEINQPLGGISMGLENIYFAHSEGRLSNEYLAEKLEHIDGYFERIKQIIDHIRIFSRDQKEILFEDVNVNQTINDALSLLRTQYENHNVELNIELAERIPIISGNKFKLEQVVLNLLTNAKDAVDEQEDNADSSYQKKITIRSYYENSSVYLEIEDNGNGIPQENLKKIFDPFFTTKDPAKGTGLGLSIIYGIIKEMNGEIEVESKVGEFSRMKIRFKVES